MGNRSNKVDGLQYERLSKRGDVAVYSVTIIEEDRLVGTVRKPENKWEAFTEAGECVGEYQKRQMAGDQLRKVATKPPAALFAWEKTPVVQAPVILDTDPVVGPAVDVYTNAPVEEEKPKKARRKSRAKKTTKKEPKRKPQPPKKIDWNAKSKDRKGLTPSLKVVGPEPTVDHPPKVSWKGKGDVKMFPISIRGDVKKNQRFDCDEQYVNGDDELTYIIVYGEEKYAEVPAKHFRVVKR